MQSKDLFDITIFRDKNQKIRYRFTAFWVWKLRKLGDIQNGDLLFRDHYDAPL